jgi:hypothetical protein
MERLTRTDHHQSIWGEEVIRFSTIVNLSGDEVVPGSSDDPVMFGGSEEVEEAGIHLDWGEYYVPDEYIDSEEDESSIEEASEANDEEIENEHIAAELCAVNHDLTDIIDINYEDDTEATAPSDPSLMGLPDSLLEHVFHYSVENAFDIIRIETVCKRVRKLTLRDEFWKRHKFLEIGDDNDGDRKVYRQTREQACKALVLNTIKEMQEEHSNIIMDVLDALKEECFADIFRTLSANIMSRMNHLGPEVQCILRGDTIGYICELLQEYMICRLQEACYLSLYAWSFPVRKDDIEFAFQGLSPYVPFSCQIPVKCNIATNEHKKSTASHGCSCGISSSSGIVWQWPLDDCGDILPSEAGRRIIRRLAYRAGICEMTNEAFVLAETELLHALGVLLVDAYESSVELSKKTLLLKEGEETGYNQPHGAFDIFKFPPPPFWKTGDGDEIYTVVPGQIRAAAERRGIQPCNVYGDADALWVTTSGFTMEEEMDIEESYYYEFARTTKM